MPVRGPALRRSAILVACVLLASAVLFCADGWTGARAESPTPRPTAAPYSSKIAVTYTYRGLPVITLVTPLQLAYIDGSKVCGRGVSHITYETIVSVTLWPWGSNPPCNEVGASVRVCEAPEQFCSNEFVYTGEDAGVELPIQDLPADIPLATARFVHDGVPQTVTITAWLFLAGGQVCAASSSLTDPAVVSVVAWGIASKCVPSGDVHVRFTTVELGDLEATFEWNGDDVGYDVDTGTFLQTPSPSPKVTPSVTIPSETASPAQLPKSGGRPEGSHPSVAKGAFIAMLFAASISALFIAAQRRRT